MTTRTAAALLAALALPALAQAPAPAEGQEGRAPAPDRSLTPDRYLARGLPSVERPWTPADYATAQAALARLAAADPLALPRKDSRASSRVFARMTARDNALAARGAPVQERLQGGADALGSLDAILATYLEADGAGKGGFGAEVVDLAIAGFAVARSTASAARELPVPEAGAADRAAFDEGSRGLSEALASQARALLMMLGDRGRLAPPDRARVAKLLAAELPMAARDLPPGFLEEAGRLAGEAAAGETSAAVKGDLARLEAAIRRAGGSPR